MLGRMMRETDRRAAAAVEKDRVLYAIYAGRLAVCLGVYGSALVVSDIWTLGQGGALPPAIRSVALGALALAGIGTPVSYWHTHRRRREAGRNFIYLQAILDVALVTGIVHITGGSASVFPPLFYIALVSGYALLLPFGPALLVAFLTGAAYMGDIAFAYPAQLSVAVILQVLIFTLVAVVASAIAARLRQVRVELRELEGELDRLRLDTADLLRTIDSGVMTLDAEGRLAYLNPAAETLLGVRSVEWLGREFTGRLEELSSDLLGALRSALEEGTTVRGREVQVGVGEEDQVPVSVSTRLLDRGQGEPLAVTVALQDLRPVRQLEELRLRTSRLEAVAELSASLAHEIRNPLASIRSAVEQIAEGETASDGETLGRLVLRESDRLNRLLGEFNDFAGVGVASRQRVELGDILDDAAAVVRQHPDTPPEAVIELEIGESPESLWGDPDLLHRTFTNLILNAVQVSRTVDTPRVRIAVDALRPDLVPPEIRLGAPVRVRVSDNGPGIEPEEMGRIFDPFYTRREGGSGLGLSIAHRAVQAHGGALLVSSELGEGATFAVILPRRDRAGESRGAEGEPADAQPMEATTE